MQLLRWLLLPFTFLYTFIIWVRNKLYDLNILHSKAFDTKTIVIGNLAVGGAGKSPLTQKLIDHFRNKYKLATLSRGYGRKTKGFRLVQVDDLVENVGDEPLQFKKNFPDITISVDENRAEGIEILNKDHNLILLDDAYQHRKVKPSTSILVFEYQSILEPIILLPTGQYRDTFDQTKRANLILISKCPDYIPFENKLKIQEKIRKHNNKADIFYSRIGYKEWIPLNNNGIELPKSKKNILLVTGIANPKPLVQHLNGQGYKLEHLKFADHHHFDDFDYKVIIGRFERLNENKDAVLLTTEKDAQRLDMVRLKDIPSYYIPIDILIENENQFFQELESSLEKN